MPNRFAKKAVASILTLSFLTGLAVTPAAAQGPNWNKNSRPYQVAQAGPGHPGDPYWMDPPGPHGPPPNVPPDRMRHYHDIWVVRPHGHWYHGYGPYHRDDEAYKWLAFTAITLGVLDLMNESQQRALEAAQIQATTAPVGESITWNNGNASGAVVATRDGTSSSGRYCREFQQTVTVGGKTENAYGTACRNADGSWQIVSTGS